MTEQQVQEFLRELLQTSDTIKYVDSFRERGLISMNKGLVIGTKDGKEFALTIVEY